jgi:hypothetical protein
MPIQPLASRIMSESKNADDEWANGMELELGSLIANNTSASTAIISRVFCNGEGCLCYLEAEQHSPILSTTGKIIASLRNDPFPQRYGIGPLNAYIWGPLNWQLILIPRPK